MSKEEKTIIEVNDSEEELVRYLLAGELVAYHDSRYGVTSGEHEILMRLLQNGDSITVYYLHVPYAYPMPEGIQNNLKTNLESALKKTMISIQYINTGTEDQKKNLQFLIEMGGEIK